MERPKGKLHRPGGSPVSSPRAWGPRQSLEKIADLFVVLCSPLRRLEMGVVVTDCGSGAEAWANPGSAPPNCDFRQVPVAPFVHLQNRADQRAAVRSPEES